MRRHQKRRKRLYTRMHCRRLTDVQHRKKSFYARKLYAPSDYKRITDISQHIAA